MKKPRCEWQKFNEDACREAATHMAGFVHSDRFVLTCEAHAQDWQRRGNGWWIAKLEGFCGNWDHVISDTLVDNQAIAEARRAGELRDSYEHQLRRLQVLADKIHG